jgi:hypothetical protein
VRTLIAIVALCLLALPAGAQTAAPEIAFSPDRDATELVVKTIPSASHSVRVAA